MVGEEEEGSFLSEDDEDEIEAKEKAEGRRKAVDLLLLKLMQLMAGWHEGLLAGLKQEVPKLVPVVTQARDDLLKETWFRHMPISSTENEHQCTGEFYISCATMLLWGRHYFENGSYIMGMEHLQPLLTLFFFKTSTAF